MLKKGDYLIFLITIVIIVLSFISVHRYKYSQGNIIAVISVDNRVVERIHLNEVEESRIIQIDGEYGGTVEVEKGRIRFVESDCPDKLCVKTGWLAKKGEVAVCLPNRAMIKIEGERIDVDIVS